MIQKDGEVQSVPQEDLIMGENYNFLNCLMQLLCKTVCYHIYGGDMLISALGSLQHLSPPALDLGI